MVPSPLDLQVPLRGVEYSGLRYPMNVKSPVDKKVIPEGMAVDMAATSSPPPLAAITTRDWIERKDTLRESLGNTIDKFRFDLGMTREPNPLPVEPSFDEVAKTLSEQAPEDVNVKVASPYDLVGSRKDVGKKMQNDNFVSSQLAKLSLDKQMSLPKPEEKK
jgi:hypothetical protein